MKGEEKASHSPNLKYFFPVDTSFDGYKQNWASWASLKQHSRGYHELILNEMPLGPHSEFLMLRMLALDTKNLGVPKVSNTEFAYDIDLRTKGDLLIFPTLS